MITFVFFIFFSFNYFLYLNSAFAQTPSKSSGVPNNYNPKVGMYIQSLYYTTEEKNKNSTFGIKMARMYIQGPASQYINYYIHADFVDSPRLLDAYIEMNLSSNFMICMGQFKTPFSTGFLIPSNATYFVNDEFIRIIQPQRDVGLQFTIKIPSKKLNLIGGIMNGALLNKTDSNNYKNIVMRGIFSPLKNFDFAVSYYSGKMNETIKPGNVEKFGGSISALRKNVVFLAEYLKSTTSHTVKDGFYALCGYDIKAPFNMLKEFEPIVRYEEYDNDTGLAGDKKKRITAGLNIYFHNRFNKIQINYNINNEETNRIKNNEFLIVFQVAV